MLATTAQELLLPFTMMSQSSMLATTAQELLPFTMMSQSSMLATMPWRFSFKTDYQQLHVSLKVLL